jgi:pescadillo protein
LHEEDEDETEQRVFATQDTEPLKRLFANLVFFVNREVPLEWMQLCTLAFGAKVAWDGPMSPFAVDDARITHQIVDRPQQGIQSLTREYVQPQWIFDCINAQMLLPTHNYRPGAKLPPHLSPFVDDDKEGYMPKYRAEIKKLQAQQSGVEVPAIEDKVVSEEESADEEDEEVQHAKAVSDGAKGKAAEAKRKAAASASSTQKKQKVAAPVSDDEEEEEPEEGSEEESSDSDAEDEEKKQALLKAYTGKSAAKKGPKGVVFQPEQKSVGEVSLRPPGCIHPAIV